MTTKKIYGDWIKWHGGECPLPPDKSVKVKFRSGIVGELRAGDYRWRRGLGDSDIVEYCVVLEQADLDAAEQLLCANGYTVTKPLTLRSFEDVVPMTEAPQKGARYWVISAVERDGVYSVPFGNDALDRLIIQRRMAYLDIEDALVAARHIFGLKGGEL